MTIAHHTDIHKQSVRGSPAPGLHV